MVRGVASMLEKHHRVQVLDEALEAAVRLSHRYIPARQLPDKAVSLLDTACARVAISQHARAAAARGLPADDRGACRPSSEIIGREETVGIDAAERRKAAEEKLAASEQLRASLEQRWNAERELVERVLAIRAKLRKGSEPVEGTGSKLEQAAEAQKDGRRRAGRRQASTPEERQALLGELAGSAGEAVGAAGRVAADPAERRRAGRRRRSCRTGPACRSAAW